MSDDLIEVTLWLLGWGWFVLCYLFSAIWFPLVVVGALCLLERLSGGFWLQNWAFLSAVIFSPLFPATNFHLVELRPLMLNLENTNWFVFILGLGAGLVLWFVHGSQMELRALKSPHQTPYPPV